MFNFIRNRNPHRYFIHLIAELLIIQSLTISGSELRYDFETKMHHHFFCTKCGRIYNIDFKCPSVEKVRQRIRLEGHQVDETCGYSKGVCKLCLKRKEDEG